MDDAGRGSISLISVPSRPADRRLAAVVGTGLAVALAVSLAMPPAALEGSEALLPAYAAALFINELITFTLLSAIALVERSRAVVILAAGYLFGSLATIPWVLSFPGAFPIIGLDAGLQGTAVIAATTRIGFPCFVLAYALLRRRPPAPHGVERAVVIAVVLVAVLVAFLTALIVDAKTELPSLMRDTRNVTVLWHVVPPMALALYGAAIAALWRGPRSILDCWLMVVVATLAAELVILSYVSGGVRLSGGWWTGRICGLISASIVLFVLISSTTALYARLARTLLDERQTRANRLIEMRALTAAIAHEVNQPLAGIVTNADAALRWLRRGAPDLGEAEAALQRIARDGHRTSRLVHDIRALIRSDMAEHAPLDLNDVILAVAAARRDEARRRGVTLGLDLGDVPMVSAGRLQMEIVIDNLLTNGLDAAAAQGGPQPSITVTTRRNKAGDADVSVTDSGPGIDAAVRARIFDPFVTTKPGGMGMGLMICRSIVETSGGQIAAEDVTPRGTSIRFTLPPAPAAAHDVAAGG